MVRAEMNRTAALLLPLLCLAGAARAEDEKPAAPAGPARKFAVVPFAALSGDVPQRAGVKAAGMLATELRNTEGLVPTDAKKAARADPYQDALARARNQVAEAKDLRAKRKFRLAEEALQKALGDFRSAAAGVTDIGEVADAYALLSAVQFNTGRDEEGQKHLTLALGLAPSRELPLQKTSPLFNRVVEEQRKALATGPKGNLLVESTPAGAAVFIDGVGLGSTPLLVKDVPAGAHLWRVQLPGELAGGVAEIAAGKQTKVSGQTSGNDPESKLLAGLSQNRLEPASVAAAKQEAAALSADLLIFGALSRSGKNLVLDSFVFLPTTGDVRRLPRATFDTELLSAGMELFNLAGHLAQNGNKAGEATPIPGPVAPDVAGGTKVAEAKYGVQVNKPDAALEEAPPPAKDETRVPLQKRTPLKK